MTYKTVGEVRQNLKDSLRHHFELIASVAKRDFGVVYSAGRTGVYEHYTARKGVEFSPNFFRNFSCIRCGNCCHMGIHLILSKSDYSYFGAYANYTVTVNGRIISFWIGNSQKDKPCPNIYWTDELDEYQSVSACMLHGHHPISCDIPVRRFRNKSEKITVWTKQQRGRNSLCKYGGKKGGCPAKPTPPYTTEERLDDIRFFEHLKACCEDLDIDNWCSELIDELQKVRTTWD